MEHATSIKTSVPNFRDQDFRAKLDSMSLLDYKNAIAV
jgi:hypothetical protein